jgi:hypothetical protein
MRLDLMQIDPTGELSRAFREMELERTGSARQAFFPDCKDGWYVGYTTTRVEGGPAAWRGKFLAMAFKPVGKGSRSGKAEEWKRVYVRAFAKRKTARARAEALYRQHNR